MSKVTLTKDETGKLVGLTEADQRAWSKFRKRIERLAPGDTATAEFRIPRSPRFHRLHFAILAALFKSQDQFQDLERFRQWVQIGAGFCDLLPGPNGKPVAVSKSIAWDRLEEAEFAEHHLAVIRFVRSPHFSRFLWPHLSDHDQQQMVEAILGEFDA